MSRPDMSMIDPAVADVAVGANETVFRWHSPDGRVTEQRRPDEPVTLPDGTEAKYLFKSGVTLPVGVPLGMESRVADPSIPLLICEGTKQYLAAATQALRPPPTAACREYAVVGISGCWGWMQDGAPLGDLLALDMLDREVIILMDADRLSNRSVYDAAKALGEFCEIEAGARLVRYADLPGGGKDGLDDILGRARTDALALRTFHRIVDGASQGPGRAPARTAGAAARAFFDLNGNLMIADFYRAITDDHHLAITQDGTVAVYRDGYYLNGSSREFNGIVADMLGNDYRKSHLENITSLALDRLKVGRQEVPLRPDRLLINVRNGLLDPVTLRLHPHDPEFRTLWQLNVEWDEDAQCPTYERWVEEVLPGRVLELEDAVCPMLDPTRTPSKAVFLFGPSRSGKSTYARLLKAIVGPEATSAVSLHQLSDDRFAAANLLDKRLNLAMDLAAREVRDLSLFKMVTGDDTIQANRKYGAQFAFENQALIVFSANEVPPVSEVSKAYLARMAPFGFPNSFLGSEDPSIEAAMRRELPGIFRRLVLALNARLKRGGQYLASGHTDDEAFRLASNKTAQFLAENTVPDEQGTDRAMVFVRYRAWCEANGTHPLGRNRFFESLRSEGVREHKPQGKGWRWNVRLVDPERHDDGSSEAAVPSFGSSGPPSPMRGTQKSTSLTPAQRPGYVGTADSGFEAAVLPFDLETGSADDLFLGGSGFVRIAHSTEGSGVQHIHDALAAGRPIAAHNGFNFDFHALGLDVAGLADRGLLIDTMVLGVLDHPPIGRRKAHQVLRDYSAQAMAERYAIEGKTGVIKAMAKEHGGFDKIPVDDEAYNAYCRQDAEIVGGFLDAIGMTEYARREMRLMGRLTGPIRGTGFRVDVPLLGRRVAEGEAARAKHLESLRSHGLPEGGKAPHMTKDGKAAIEKAFADLGVVLPRTPGDSPALGKDVLLALELTGEAAALAETVLLLNGVRTIYGTIEQHRVGDRVHPSVMPLQASGRFSVRDPGLTVMGKRGGKHVERAVYLPDEGGVLVAFDLDQIDARAVAVHSQDPAYLDLFGPGMDSHQEVADMLGLPREQAKAIAHGWNYGEGIRALVRNTGLPEEIVRQFDQGMREKFPRLVEWRQEVYELGKSGALLDNGFGRLLSVDPEFAFTQSPAYMGQSTARDLMAEGVLRLPLDIARMMRAFVHDEIVLSIPEESVEEVTGEVLKALTFTWGPPDAEYVIEVTAGASRVGRTWAECYEKGGQ